MSTSSLVDYYTKTFRLQPSLRARELKGIIDKGHNFKVTMSMSSRIRTSALTVIISYYNAHLDGLEIIIMNFIRKTLVLHSSLKDIEF